MGQGIISVSSALFEDTTKQPETLAEWHALLMLPEEYHLLEAKADVVYPLWLITVESDAIPLPNVTPIYHRDDTNQLDRIESASEHKVIWQRSKQ